MSIPIIFVMIVIRKYGFLKVINFTPDILMMVMQYYLNGESIRQSCIINCFLWKLIMLGFLWKNYGGTLYKILSYLAL